MPNNNKNMISHALLDRRLLIKHPFSKACQIYIYVCVLVLIHIYNFTRFVRQTLAY